MNQLRDYLYIKNLNCTDSISYQIIFNIQICFFGIDDSILIAELFV